MKYLTMSISVILLCFSLFFCVMGFLSCLKWTDWLINWLNVFVINTKTRIRIAVIILCSYRLYAYWLGRRTCNREVAGSSPGRSVPSVTLGKLFTHLCLCSSSSINWYRRKLAAKQALTWHTSLVSVDLQLRLVSGWRAIETEISAALGLWASGRTLDFLGCRK